MVVTLTYALPSFDSSFHDWNWILTHGCISSSSNSTEIPPILCNHFVVDVAVEHNQTHSTMHKKDTYTTAHEGWMGEWKEKLTIALLLRPCVADIELWPRYSSVCSARLNVYRILAAYRMCLGTQHPLSLIFPGKSAVSPLLHRHATMSSFSTIYHPLSNAFQVSKK